VYGLGADATSDAAVRRVFAAKGRPATNPLIVHVADVATARRYATRWPEAADRLAAAYWPGPLTLVLPKTADIPGVVTAGRGTVGLRAPDHPLALGLLRAFGGPVAAPSANRSNRISPTTAQHVREELGDAVDLILDGGPCAVGIESTVLDLSGDAPRILRPGGVSRAQVEAVIGPVRMTHATQSESVAAAAPGQHAVHYAPHAPAYRVPYGRVREGIETLGRRGSCAGVIMLQSSNRRCGWGGMPLQVLPDDPAEYARRLYAALRHVDASLPHLPSAEEKAILVEMPPDAPEWAAVRDRLLRATKPLDP
jgi:L-threonylcarbamoyladenylate synthase